MKKKTKSAINIVQLNNYNSPNIKVDKKNDWVTFGDKNSYFQYLIDRYSGSATNNAIINGISQMIYGKGIDATDNNIFPNEYAQAITLLNKKSVRKLAYDLKLMGQCAIQIIYSKDRKTIAQIEHMPVETLAMEKCDDDGEIKGFYYCADWEKIKPNEVPKRIPAFGTSKESIEILYVRPYVAGHYYFSPVDYQGGLQYSELEEEIANYHLNNIINGLAPSMLINFNNGVPNEEERAIIEKRILDKYSGSSNAGRFILSFNENADTESSIEAIQLSDAHNQYQFLSDEGMRKIMVSHRVISPMLLGIKDQSGLGNNADELKTASTLMDNTVIRPFQELLLDAFNEILAYNGISLNLYFKTLQPLEFIEIDETLVDDETKEEETGVKMKSHLEDQIANDILMHLDNANLNEQWEVVDTREVDHDIEDDNLWASTLIEEKKSITEKFADAITAKPSGFSYLDKSFYKIRYKYAQKYSSSNTRNFCKIMMRKANNGNVYRLEDIDKASREGVNRQLGHKPNGADKPQPYDLFKFKGGVNCGHIWEQVLYRLKDKTKKSDKIYDYNEVKSIPKSYVPSPRGTKESKIAPIDMDNNGHHPNYNG